MFKSIIAFVIAGMLVATSASAYELTYLGTVPAKESKRVKVALPIGKSVVEVFSESKDYKFNCKFGTDGRVVIEQSNTTKCALNPNVAYASDMEVTIDNLEPKMLDFKIWVHDPIDSK